MKGAAVLEVAVIGVPDELWTEAVKAVVVRRPGGTGKLQKNVLREQYRAKAAAAKEG